MECYTDSNIFFKKDYAIYLQIFADASYELHVIYKLQKKAVRTITHSH